MIILFTFVPLTQNLTAKCDPQYVQTDLPVLVSSHIPVATCTHSIKFFLKNFLSRTFLLVLSHVPR